MPTHVPAPEPMPGDIHAHVADLETCLDLVNTVELADGVPSDSLARPADAIRWLVEHGIAHEDAIEAQARADPEGWLAGVHAARAALRSTWDALVEGRPHVPEDLARLNAVLASSPHAELQPAAGGLRVGHRHSDADPTGEALAQLVRPLVDAVAAGATARFRICANDGCRWVFEDTSRAGRRRWCDMTTCGNRAKVQRYRSRRRDQPETSGDGREARPTAGDAARPARGAASPR